MHDTAERKGQPQTSELNRKQQPQCGFGELGLCCYSCGNGPCRIDPFGHGPKYGICGADADVIVARNFVRMVGTGASVFARQAKSLLKEFQRRVLLDPDALKPDQDKLFEITRRLGLADAEPSELLRQVAQRAFEEFPERQEPSVWLRSSLPSERADTFKQAQVMPYGIDSAINELFYHTAFGSDADTLNIILAGIKGGLAAFSAASLSADLSDIMFVDPQAEGLSSGFRQALNIALCSNDSLTRAWFGTALIDLQNMVREAGVDGINFWSTIGSMRTVFEAMTNGVLDLVFVDDGYMYPLLTKAAESTGVRVVNVGKNGVLPGIPRLSLKGTTGYETLRQACSDALCHFKSGQADTLRSSARNGELFTGMEDAEILKQAHLTGQEAWQPLLEQLLQGEIRGLALLVGSQNLIADENLLQIARLLSAHNVFVLTDSLNTGCVRELHACSFLAEKLGIDLTRLPAVISIPAYGSEQNLTVAIYGMALGLPVHFGTAPPIYGSGTVLKLLTEELQDLFGGCFILERDPEKVVQRLLSVLEERRSRINLAIR